ncbi:aminotransferase class I/II-fold pyridoxal phosphate-dependent enzyme [Anaerosacchariphilus polymeriproducens]|uniref:Aminotransferase class I/II-fold pyridoxal phosphate-dependent enzyme n=1 Tax=Anaerosacchariphilus polymeriproducens TaxID=1812858 RepID=A0A371AWD9_9FIRM|nr:aminotransferase class I/II-fold pyridoxal phosphate-dependent enzyme [Anaerosacchariphilus polymeriproducens]RDU23780.1 aminotransferase class I/II-fold pyridoxal phosphate-dependent enzyme [Anaerosacchariphilus polymeriproducens]
MLSFTQEDLPIFDALEKQRLERLVHFDVPGHKGGRGNKELKQCLGETCVKLDVNSMKPLDNLCHPSSVIKEAQKLAAEAFGADEAFFIVNGTTAAVQGMIMSVCKAGDKVIMPRNVHRSAINALVINGAIPVYINPGINKHLGIPLGMTMEDVERTILENPDAKAILVNNPTYYGICSNIVEIVKLAHKHGMLVLADEAHGTHFYFGENLPISAMAAGADMSAVSMHKTGGSLTQSSLLLTKNTVNADYVRQIINLTQTTSASYLLLSSLDIARKNLVKNGKEMFARMLQMADYAREEINRMEGYYAFGEELVDRNLTFDFDQTKLSIHTRDIGLAGIEVYDILRDDYGIQIEFGDIGNILAIISAGDRNLEIERLIAALSEIKRIYKRDKAGLFDHEYINPKIVMGPQEAFYAEKESLLLNDCSGRICGEFVMCYPPGIPILAPGEKITDDILNYTNYAKEKGCFMTGTEDMNIEYINVVK